MRDVTINPAGNIGKGFIPQEFLPKGKDEYYLRNQQSFLPSKKWRHLQDDEVQQLLKNNNTSDNWQDILVTEKFDPNQIHNSKFYGLVRIGTVQNAILEHHDLRLPIGITNSIIVSSDIGDNVAIHNVRYLAHYIIGNECILFNVNEMLTTNQAKFGNGIIKQGEKEEARIWLDLINEAGCRKVLPFDGMIPADAYIWAKYRDDSKLQKKLVDITQNQFENSPGQYGTVGEKSVIKNSRNIKDVKVGISCYIKGSNKLKNLTINSTQTMPTQIGEGVELVNGIVAPGCNISYGSKAIGFVLGENSSLKYGARLFNTFLGDNSTISCCEVLNNLIFPAHEQHHNSSFLIASVIKGQSNIAAGAIIGSNHNSRANDNEIEAGRGFWPGLCSSLKHSCRFASFVLLSKADFPAELDIPMPFALLNNNVTKDQLEVFPAFWWLYNMYALARNAWKFNARDKRSQKSQNIEFESLAPDTVEEMFYARYLLELFTGKAYLRNEPGQNENKTDDEIVQIGRKLLNNSKDQVKSLEILAEGMEKSRRKVIIIKACDAYHAYGDMLHYYAVKNILDFMNTDAKINFTVMSKQLNGEREKEWINIGGQLISEKDVDQLRFDINNGKLKNWEQIHKRYNTLWGKYPLQKQQHAFATLCDLYETKNLNSEQWQAALQKAIDIQNYISEQVYISRKKDYENSFRQATFRNSEEMNAALGTIDDDTFIQQTKDETKQFIQTITEIKDQD